MKRLLPAVVLTFAASASCTLDLKGRASTSSDDQTATTSTTGSGGGTTATASGGTTGAGGAGGAQSTSTAASSSTGTGGPVWTLRRKLDLDLGTNATLASFPILVLLETNRIDYGKTQDAGQDLRFTDDQNKVLDHEIERWNEGGTSVVWVRIPELKKNGGTLTTIWMYYGNDKAVDGQSIKEVWSNGYHGVWHLGESGNQLADSSGTTLLKAYSFGATESDGLIGKGRSFNAGDHQYIDTYNADQLPKFTIEVCVRSNNPPSTNNGPNGPLMREQNYQILWDNNAPYNGSASFKPQMEPNWNSSSMMPLNDNTWYYLAATYDGSTLRTYKDGVHQSSDVGANTPDTTVLTAKIGRHAYGVLNQHFFNGDIDEVRIADASRPDEWFVAQDRSMRDKLVKFGKEETNGGPWAVP